MTIPSSIKCMCPLNSLIMQIHTHTHTHKFVKVILDLGHVTFGNVSDWSAEEKSLGIEAHLPDIDEDDDGKCLRLLCASLNHPHTLLIPHTPSSPLTHSLFLTHPPYPPTHPQHFSPTHTPTPTHTLIQMSSPHLPPPLQAKRISQMEHLSHRT